MSNYRRALASGGCWFFTVNLLDRQKALLTDRIEILRDVVAATRETYPFAINAFVVLPDHLHAIWELPSGDTDFSVRWRLIRTRFAKALPANERLSAVRAARKRTRPLAAAVLGTSHSRWGRLRAPCWVLLLQSRQARARLDGARLAVLVVSLRCPRGTVSRGLGRWRQVGRRVWRACV